MIQKMICDYKSINKLLIYEKAMIKKCKHLTDDYANLFKPYGCELKLEYFWANFFRNNRSLIRESFVNGYEFYVAISVIRNGKIVRYKDLEGELDYYEIAFSWALDTITRKGFKLHINYIPNVIEEIREDLLGFKEVLNDITKNNLEITY